MPKCFHVDYVVEDADPLTRPVTFIFNGARALRASFCTCRPLDP